MPKTFLDESISDVRAEINSARRRNNKARSDVDSTNEALDKISLKLDRLDTDVDRYKARLAREFARKERELLDQIVKLYKILEQYEVEDLHDQVDSVEETRGLKVARTVAILESLVDSISGTYDSFKTMSKAVLYTNVYEKLFLSNEYLIDKVPETFEDLVKDGQKFVKDEVMARVNTSLEKPEVWEDTIDDVERWWKEEVLPYLYEDVSLDLIFDEDPAPLDHMLEARKTAVRQHELFPEVVDAMDFLKGRVQEAYDTSGLTGTLAKLKASGCI